MADRLTTILAGHIKLAGEMLNAIDQGVTFETDFSPFPLDRQALMNLISKWEGELSRHEDRKAAKKR